MIIHERAAEASPDGTRWGRWLFIGAWVAMGVVSAVGSVIFAMLISYKLIEFADCRGDSSCSPSTVMSANMSAMFCLGCTYIVSGVVSLLIGLAETRRPIRAAALSGVGAYLVGVLITLGMLVPAIGAAYPQ